MTDTERACRDRWENILSIRECGMERENSDYINGLLGELESYYHAGLMPDDVRADYEMGRVERNCPHCGEAFANTTECPACGHGPKRERRGETR